jgi:hypothetical protein
MSSSITTFSGLYFSLKKTLVAFDKFILRNFIVFEGILNRTVSLISFLVCSILVYKKPTDFSMLILYPANLLKQLIISISFLVVFKSCLCIGTCHLQIGIIWLLPSLLESLLFSYICLIALASNSKTTLNRSGESNHPCLIPVFSGFFCCGLVLFHCDMIWYDAGSYFNFLQFVETCFVS